MPPSPLVAEVIVTRELGGDQVFTDAIIAHINPKLASSILTQLSKQLPLQSFNLDHLKRVRRVPNLPGAPAVEFRDKDTGAVSSYAFRLQVIVCPPRAFPSLQAEVCQALGYDADAPISVETIRVCKVAPESREEFEAWNGNWPTLYRPDNLCREREKGTHTADDELLLSQYMQLACADGATCRDIAIAAAGVGAWVDEDEDMFAGACIVNPANHKVCAPAPAPLAWKPAPAPAPAPAPMQVSGTSLTHPHPHPAPATSPRLASPFPVPRATCRWSQAVQNGTLGRSV